MADTERTRERRRPAEVREWLRQEPPLSELAEAFPGEWRVVQRELAQLGESNDTDTVKRYIASLSMPAPPRPGAKVRPAEREQAALSVQVQRHMAAAALRQARLISASGVSKGRVRFNLVNGWVAQKLLFERDLVRKPVSIRRFRTLWPLLWQRRRLMPLVEPKGIYCFYSSEFVSELARLIDGRSCLEIGAGDGTLARFLRDAGVEVTATDDQSWQQSIDYPADVRRLDARQALRDFRPQVVICSWPPPGNSFERDVFKTRSVELYIAIVSRDEMAAGNWDAYRAQTNFEYEKDERLSRLVLPPEIDPAVLLFRRLNPGEDQG